MNARRDTRRPAFSLVELVVVIVIIGIIAAMAIPRLSRGTAGAADSALAGNLAIMRNAINLYSAEHNSAFPTQADFEGQLTQFSSLTGAVNASRDAAHPFGPYILAIPPCPVGDQTTPTAVAFDAVNSPPSVVADVGGWIYNPSTGEFLANTNLTDQNGRAYNTY
jgi:prepilin-type N-terminal cleavage/methylation domain-containing protein